MPRESDHGTPSSSSSSDGARSPLAAPRHVLSDCVVAYRDSRHQAGGRADVPHELSRHQLVRRIVGHRTPAAAATLPSPALHPERHGVDGLHSLQGCLQGCDLHSIELQLLSRLRLVRAL